MTTTEDRNMNGRKARALRKQAVAISTEPTSYTEKLMKTAFTPEGKAIKKITRSLSKTSQRAIYQQLKKEFA